MSCVLIFQGCGEEKSDLSKTSHLKISENNTAIEVQKEEEIFEEFSKLSWETNMDNAFERAKKEHKNVMIMVEDTRCKWCAKMKKDVLSNQNIQDKLQEYVLLKVQRADKDTTKQIEGFTGAVPSFHFMKADKEMMDSIIGYFNKEDFLNYLVEIKEDN